MLHFTALKKCSWQQTAGAGEAGGGRGLCTVTLWKAYSANFHSHVCKRHHTRSTEVSTTFGASERFLSPSLNDRLTVDLVPCFGSPSLASSLYHLVFHPLFSYSFMRVSIESQYVSYNGLEVTFFPTPPPKYCFQVEPQEKGRFRSANTPKVR